MCSSDLLGFFLHFPSLAIWFFVLFRDLVQAKRRKLRKAAEVRCVATGAAGETLGPQASVTTEGPVGRSVEEVTKPVEGGSMGQERREAMRPDEEEPMASSPPVVEPREERQATRSPTPLRQVSPPEHEETANLETAESGTLAGPSVEMDMAAQPGPRHRRGGAGATGERRPRPHARGEPPGHQRRQPQGGLRA